MDINRNSGSVCTCHPSSYQGSTLQKMLVPPGREMYYPGFMLCDRTPQIDMMTYHQALDDSRVDYVQELDNHRLSDNSRTVESNTTTTLKSVLRGEVPAAYSHLTSSRPPSHSTHHRHDSSPSHSKSQRVSTPLFHQQQHAYSPTPQRVYSPVSREYSPVRHSPYSPCSKEFSPSPIRQQTYSPGIPVACPESVIDSTETADSDSQEEPMDLSCNKPITIKPEPRDSTSPASFHSFYSSSSPSRSTTDEDGDDHKTDFSMLRNLLCIGKRLQRQAESAHGHLNLQGEDWSCRQPSPCPSNPDIEYGQPITGTTRITLAKKNMFPVSSRVSDWLVKIVQFAKAIPEFANLSHNDKVTLILSSWTRLLLLYMSENNFQFAVTPLPSDPQKDSGASPAPDEPTMKSVESIQAFVTKCQSMSLDQKEFAFLRMAVLFNGGYVGLDRPDVVDQLNSLVQQLLQQHALATRPCDVMHYSRLLMCLPALYGINCKMIENLFCRHITGNMDMEVLLKEMLQNL